MALGRPPTITEEDKRVVIELVAMGCSVRAAAARIGVDEKAIRHLKQTDETFFRNLKKALSECEQEHVTNIRAAGSLQWQASAWFLERRWGKDWGRKERLEHSGPRGGPIKIEAKATAQKILDNPDVVAKLEEAERLGLDRTETR
jgi:hypothetical protein